MAKKQSNIGMFERAGYALGASKSPAAGFDYVKGIAVAMEDMDRIDASIKKTQDLMKKGRGKGRSYNVKYAPDFRPPNGKTPRFDPFKVRF